jgi:hypothetical protein
MKLAEVIKQGQPRNKSGCHTKKVLQAMPKEDREAVESAVSSIRSGSAKFSMNWISAQINASGYKISSTTFGRHVKGECGCEFK